MHDAMRACATALSILSLSLSHQALSAATIVVSETSGLINSDIYSSTAQPLPANAETITAHVRFRSKRNATTADVYNLRKVDWRVIYSYDNVNYIATPFKTVELGATLDYVADSIQITIPGSHTVYMKLDFQSADSAGTFTGPIEYQYSTAETFDTSGPQSDSNILFNQDVTDPVTKSISLALPTYSPPSGWEIYKVNYDYDMAYYLSAKGSSTTFAAIEGAGFNRIQLDATPLGATAGDIAVFTKQFLETTTYDPTTLSASAIAYTTKSLTSEPNTARSDIAIENGHALISIRNPIVFTAPVNEFVFDTYDYTTHVFDPADMVPIIDLVLN